MYVHPTLAVSEAGVALGVLDVWVRQPKVILGNERTR